VTEQTADVLHLQAQRAFLAGLGRGDSLLQLEHAVREFQAKTFTPDLAVLEIGVAAMDLAQIDRTTPIQKAELISEHLTEINFRNQRALQERTTYALNAVAAIRGGLELDVLEDPYWWRTRDIVEYAVIAATAYVRACAHRLDLPIAQFTDQLLTKLGRPPR
jgi:hypothetical protein